MRVLYSERRSALVESLTEEFGSEIEVLGGEAGMYLTITLRNGCDDLEIAERAARQKLWVWPLSTCYQGKAPRAGFILGFGSTTVDEIPRAVRKFRNVLLS
jgi:GntR family transcriptional regulator/MocR family aminotransferase